MYKVNILGKNTFTFKEIFDKYEYGSKENYDFDLFVTDGFHLSQVGRSEPKLKHDDLKTKKLIIFNYDKCSPLKGEFFPFVEEFIKDTDIDCLVLTLHHLTNKDDLPKSFEYDSFDFFVFQVVQHYGKWNDISKVWKENFHYLRPKKFLSYNNVPHNHRIELRKFLEEKGHIGEGWFSFNPREDDGINLDCIEGFGNQHFTEINLGLILTSYFSILTETIFSDDDIPSVKLTNKVFMTMKSFHPFFIIGQPKTLNYLKQNGFKTFDRFWNEDYDSIFEHEDRMSKILDSLGEVLGQSNENIHRKLFGNHWDGSLDEGDWRNLFDILEHNYNHLPIHASNQKAKISQSIQKFMDKS